MTNGYLFREYIGAQSTGVKFSDVPINGNLSFHFILAFAIDYTPLNQQPTPTPTNGVFHPFWDTAALSPAAVAAVKRAHPNTYWLDGVDVDYEHFAPNADVNTFVECFYGYGDNTDVRLYVRFYDEQAANYPGGKVLSSFLTGDTTGLISPDLGISAARELQRQNKLPGLFIWSADSSKKSSYGFKYETQGQQIIANH
ncbi:hypothetical protein EJB05_27917, partial [Eragrostis curvula]